MKITVEIEDHDLELLNALALREFRTPGKQLAYMVAMIMKELAPLDALSQVRSGTTIVDETITPLFAGNSYAEAQELGGFKMGEEVMVIASGEIGPIQDIRPIDRVLQVGLGQGIGVDKPWLAPEELTHMPTVDEGQ